VTAESKDSSSHYERRYSLLAT